VSNQPKTVLINLISCEGANVGKALRMGRKFLAAEWQVVLSMNIEGVTLLDPTVGGKPCPVVGKPLIELLQAFQSAGGQVLVGAECLTLTGWNEDCLLPGMELATFPVLAEILGRPGTRTMTW